jgi:galactose mutarotase-like enzyme
VAQGKMTRDTYQVEQINNLIIGGQPVFKLLAPFSESQKEASIISATVLPGRGMNVFQLKAFLPDYGLFNMFSSFPVEEAPDFFTENSEDFMGNKSFLTGGAILLPFAGRIRGKLLSDGKSLEVKLLDKTVILPANWSSDGNSQGEKIAHHGLILKKHMHTLETGADSNSAFIEGVLYAGDYDGRWLGWALHTIRCSLSESGFILTITTKNTGNEDMPVSIGWHPYFSFPGQNRKQVKLHIPAKSILKVNNYHDVYPTGKITPVFETDYDFTQSHGKPLDELYLDDCFINLQEGQSGTIEMSLYDPEVNYGVNVTANDVVNAVQLYSPKQENFIAIEPQINLPDQYNRKIWGDRDTGITILKKDEELLYKVAVQLF